MLGKRSKQIESGVDASESMEKGGKRNADASIDAIGLSNDVMLSKDEKCMKRPISLDKNFLLETGEMSLEEEGSESHLSLESTSFTTSTSNSSSPNLSFTTESVKRFRDLAMRSTDYKLVHYYALSLINLGQDAKIKEGVSILKGLHRRGITPATFELGIGCERGYVEGSALTYYAIAANKGHALACTMMGIAYENGVIQSDPIKNSKLALNFHIQGAKGNSPGSLLYVAHYYMQQDTSLGVQWLKQASERANKDYPDAPFELGTLLEKGITNVIEKNDEMAILEYTRSAELGNGNACFRLGLAFQKGQIGCCLDDRRALYFFELGKKIGHAQCKLAVSEYMAVGLLPTMIKNEELAFELALEAAESKTHRASYVLGLYYYKGIGVVQDLEKARQCFEESLIEDKFQPAKRWLKFLDEPRANRIQNTEKRFFCKPISNGSSTNERQKPKNLGCILM